MDGHAPCVWLESRGSGAEPIRSRGYLDGERCKAIFWMYVLSIIYLRPLNLKSTASGVSGASLACGASRESLESGASRPSEGENGRLKIDVAENIRSLLHFRGAVGAERLQEEYTRKMRVGSVP
jgi:hypothetical protein